MLLAETAPNVSPTEAGKRIAKIKAEAAAAAGAVDKKFPKSEEQGDEPDPKLKKLKKPVPGAKKSTKKAEADEADAEPDADQDNSDEGQSEAEGEDDGERADPAAEDDDQPSEDEGQDPDDEAEAQDDDDAEDETLHTVIVDGKEEQVTLKEALQGYSRTKDYTKKTEALAKQRKEVEALQEKVKDLPQQREKYVQGGERFVKNAALVLHALQARFMPGEPDKALLKTDPASYFEKKELRAEAMQFAQALQDEMLKMEGEVKTNHKQALAEGRSKLLEIRPELKDAAVKGKLINYARGFGFTDDQLANEPNHVLFDFAYKAMLYDELMARKKTVKQNVNRPKVMKQSKAEETRAAKEHADRQNVLSEHASTGTVNSGAAAISKLLSGRKKA